MSIKSLYLCEKPDQARKVAKELGPVARQDGWIDCANDVVVTWGFGHLFQPMMPEDYTPDWKGWDWDTLPIIPKPFRFKPRDDAKKQIRTIFGLIDKAREVVVATDPDREGELIAYLILTEKGYKGPIRRAIFQDLTPALIRKALNNLEPGEKYYPWYQAALARTCADWIVGLNLTRAATKKLRPGGGGTPLSVGRVQTPTLALLVRNERRILDFKPQDYFELTAAVKTANGHSLKMRFAPAEDRRITDSQKIEDIRKRAVGAKGPLVVVHEDKETAPPELLDLNALQQQANSRFGWSSQKTLDIAQSLYDGTNKAGQPLLSYPRTDCRVLAEDHVGRIEQQMENLLSLPSFSRLASKLAKPIVRKSTYDDSRLGAHTAIVPTLEKAKITELTADERKIYELVCRFYLAAHLPNYRYKATKVQLDANGVPFAVGGTVPMHPGWKEAFSDFDASEDEAPEDGEEESGPLPPVMNGEPARIDDIGIDKKKTKPPVRFTEAKLLKAMQNIAAFVDDAAAKKRLKMTSGIGTPATRAGIIEVLKKRNYIKVEKRKLVPTEIGMGLIQALETATPDYADPAITARWEDGLEAIANRQLGVADFVGAIVDKVRNDVVKLRNRDDLGTFAGGQERKGPFIPAEKRAEIMQTGIEIHVPYGKNEEAMALGFVFHKEKKCWIAPADTDRAKLVSMGWLNADGTRPVPVKAPSPSGMRWDEVIKQGFRVHVPYGKNEEAKALGLVFDGKTKSWFAPPNADRAKLVEVGYINADGSVPEPPRKGGGGFQNAGAPAKPPAAAGKVIKLAVTFEQRAAAGALGARWNKEEKFWYAADGANLDGLRQAGFLQ